MSKKQAASGVCIIKGCQGKRHARGLCADCYGSFYAREKAGKNTWEELEKLGLALPVKGIGRPQSSSVLKALKKKTSQRSAK